MLLTHCFTYKKVLVTVKLLWNGEEWCNRVHVHCNHQLCECAEHSNWGVPNLCRTLIGSTKGICGAAYQKQHLCQTCTDLQDKISVGKPLKIIDCKLKRIAWKSKLVSSNLLTDTFRHAAWTSPNESSFVYTQLGILQTMIFDFTNYFRNIAAAICHLLYQLSMV